jgi:type I restriction enzyme S subunit
MAETRRVKLGDVADFLTGFPFKSADYTDDASGVRLLRGDNIVQGALRWEGVKRWPASLVDQHELYLLTSGDVVVAMDRPWIEAGLKYAALADEDCPSLLVQRVTRLRETNHIKARYLRYVIGSRAFTEHVLAVQTGTAVPHISGGQIKAFEFLLPPLPTQEAVTSVLGALDDKIELNRRMNETLEAMARAIFNDWFIDFGPTRAKMEGRAPYLAPDIWSVFPDRLDEKGNPEGWRAKPLDQIADFLNGLALQKYPPNGGDTLPVIKIAQLRAGSMGSADRASTEIPSEYIVEDGDVLFSWSGSLLHRVWTAGRGALNQHLFKVTSKHFPKWFYFYWVAQHMPSFQATAASKATTMGHIQRHHLTQASTVIGTPSVMKAADRLIAPLFDRQIANDLESRTLAATRDLLLPKLMSGEVRVRDAEKAVEATR